MAESPGISNNHLLKDPRLSNWDIQGFRSLHAILCQHVVSVQYKVGKGHFALRKWKNLPKRLAGARCPLVSLRRFFQFEKFQVFNFDWGHEYALIVNIALMRIILQMPLVQILGSISFFFQPFSAPTRNSKFIILQKYQIFIARGNLPPFYKSNISCVTSFLQTSDGMFSCFSDHQHHWCLIQLQLLNLSRKEKKAFLF